MNTANFEFCYRHQAIRPVGEQCGQCAAEASAAQQRELLNSLKALVDDLLAENVDLRRRVSALEHSRNHFIGAHNRLVGRVDVLEGL